MNDTIYLLFSLDRFSTLKSNINNKINRMQFISDRSSEIIIRLRKQHKCLHRLRKDYRRCRPLWQANWRLIIPHRIGSWAKDHRLDHLAVLTINDIHKATMTVDAPWKNTPGYHQDSDLIRSVNNPP